LQKRKGFFLSILDKHISQQPVFFYFFLSLILVLASCEKAINFKLNDTTEKVVLEAKIEDGQNPTVVLTHSLSYFKNLSPEILENAFVRNAEIQISNGSETRTLKEYADTLYADIVLYHYAIDTLNEPPFRGEQGKQYTLDIKAEGKTYKAVTTIPLLTKTMDSIWWKPAPNNPDTTLVILMGRFTDPPGYGNYIRYFTRVNDWNFLPGLASVFDDQVVDGTQYNFQVDKGVDRNEEIDFENYAYFSRGDSVTVKFCNIDKATYDFWRTLEYSYSSIGNPFSSPTRVQSNIQGGALGYFGGYAVQYVSIVIPE
jgi:hypothetical protein